VRQQQLQQSQQQPRQQRYFSSDTAASSSTSSSSALVTTSESTMTDISTMTTLEQVTTSSILPPSISAATLTTQLSFWGMTGLLLTNLHTTLHIPYWACIALTNVLIRSAMIPIVVHGAKTQVKLGSVSPEVQYLLTSFTTDMTTLGKAAGGGGQEKVGQQKNSSNSDYYVNQLYKGRIILIKATMETLRGIYRMKDINPLSSVVVSSLEQSYSCWLWYC
jgi:membrane protein insertase Oxa1/YidC/SpoIIIJ